MGFASSSEQIGNYQAALKLKLLLSTLVSSLGNIFLPRLSQNFKEKNMTSYWHTVNKSLRYTCFISFPIIGLFLTCSDNIILLFCGSKYTYAAAILKVLVVTVLFVGISTVTGIQILLSMEKEKCLFISIVAGTAVNFVMNLLLIPRYHGLGAAFTTVCAEFVVLIVQLIFLRRACVKLPLISFMKKPFFGAAAAFLAVFFFQKIITLSTFFNLLLSCLLFASVYFVVLFILKEEILREILSILKKRSRHEF
jgi:O-antigen/teichoic acid export membrane protein